MRFLPLLLVLLSASAGASSVHLAWASASGAATGLGTDTVTLAGPATLTLDVRLGADAAGVPIAFASLEFDRDLGDELDLIFFEELSWSGAMTRLDPFTAGLFGTQESTTALVGQLYTFDSTTLEDGPTLTTLTFGRVVFVARPVTDGPDVFTLLTDFDGIFNNAGDPVEATLGTASVNLVPEPASAALLGLGLALLARATKR